jgi:hypothetical protein
MGAESSKSTGGDRRNEIQKQQDVNQSAIQYDALRAQYQKGELKEAKKAKESFNSNPERVARVNTWATESSRLHGYRVSDENPIKYDQVGTSSSMGQGSEARFLPDLDAPSDKELQSYTRKRDKCIADTRKEIREASDKYYSDMKKLDEKRHRNPQERRDVLKQRYDNYMSDAQQILYKKSITMAKLATRVGIDPQTVKPYTSDTQHGGIHQLPGEPQYDEYGRLLLS